jgi:hypothetical protein
MDDKALAKVMDDLDLERTYENILIGGMFSIMVVVVLAQYLQSLTGAKLTVTSAGYPAVAGNAGVVWVQMTPPGQPNQVKIIAENSTGAFEEVLLGLTT